MEEASYIMMTLFLPEKDFKEINAALKYHVQNSSYLNTILGTVRVDEVSVTYKLNMDYSIGILVSCKGVPKLPYHLVVKRLEDINDVININRKKHQLQISSS